MIPEDFSDAMPELNMFAKFNLGQILGHLFLSTSLTVEREWWIDEKGTAYIVDLALPVGDGWLPVTFGDRPGPAGGLRFAAEAEAEACLREVQARLRIS